jgi:hypothetical protein
MLIGAFDADRRLIGGVPSFVRRANAHSLTVGGERHAEIIARMQTRERMHARQMALSRLQAMYDDES